MRSADANFCLFFLCRNHSRRAGKRDYAKCREVTGLRFTNSCRRETKTRRAPQPPDIADGGPAPDSAEFDPQMAQQWRSQQISRSPAFSSWDTANQLGESGRISLIEKLATRRATDRMRAISADFALASEGRVSLVNARIGNIRSQLGRKSSHRDTVRH